MQLVLYHVIFQDSQIHWGQAAEKRKAEGKVKSKPKKKAKVKAVPIKEEAAPETGDTHDDSDLWADEDWVLNFDFQF